MEVGGFQEPEEEVFSLSLETDHSPDWDWPYLDTTFSSCGSVFNLSCLASPLAKKSYQSGNRLLTQLEITPSMRFSLLDWLITVRSVLHVVYVVNCS